MADSQFDMSLLTFNRTYELFSSRWKVYLVYAVGNNTYRMGVLRRMFPMISRVTLTSYLQQLERDGFILREAYPAPPLHVEYSLTPMGLSVVPLITQLIEWGEVN